MLIGLFLKREVDILNKEKIDIYLFQDADMEKTNIEVFVNSWNSLNEDRTPFHVIINPSLSNGNNAGIWLINKQLKAETFDVIKEHLDKKPNLSICFFLEAKEMSFIDVIDGLQNEYIFSTIGTVMKPTQFSRVDSFLKSVMSRRDMVTFDESDFNGIDFDFEE